MTRKKGNPAATLAEPDSLPLTPQIAGINSPKKKWTKKKTMVVDWSMIELLDTNLDSFKQMVKDCPRLVHDVPETLEFIEQLKVFQLKLTAWTKENRYQKKMEDFVKPIRKKTVTLAAAVEVDPPEDFGDEL